MVGVLGGAERGGGLMDDVSYTARFDAGLTSLFATAQGIGPQDSLLAVTGQLASAEDELITVTSVPTATALTAPSVPRSTGPTSGRRRGPPVGGFDGRPGLQGGCRDQHSRRPGAGSWPVLTLDGGDVAPGSVVELRPVPDVVAALVRVAVAPAREPVERRWSACPGSPSGRSGRHSPSRRPCCRSTAGRRSGPRTRRRASPPGGCGDGGGQSGRGEAGRQRGGGEEQGDLLACVHCELLAGVVAPHVQRARARCALALWCLGAGASMLVSRRLGALAPWCSGASAPR